RRAGRGEGSRGRGTPRPRGRSVRDEGAHAAAEQGGGDTGAQAGRPVGGVLLAHLDQVPAVAGEDHSAQGEPPVRQGPAVTGDGTVVVRAQTVLQGAFRGDAGPGGRVVERVEQVDEGGVVDPAG